MGAGGIIHQQAARLVEDASDPCFYDQLPDHCKRRVDTIKAKPELSRDLNDVMTLLGLLHVAVHA